MTAIAITLLGALTVATAAGIVLTGGGWGAALALYGAVTGGLIMAVLVAALLARPAAARRTAGSARLARS